MLRRAIFAISLSCDRNAYYYGEGGWWLRARCGRLCFCLALLVTDCRDPPSAQFIGSFVVLNALDPPKVSDSIFVLQGGVQNVHSTVEGGFPSENSWKNDGWCLARQDVLLLT